MSSSASSGNGRSVPWEAAAWFSGWLVTASLVATVLWVRDGEFRAPWILRAEQGLLFLAVGALLLGSREPGARRCAAAAGAAAGVLVGITLAQRAPTAWFMQDVAWHCAKVALAASGRPLEDPILRVPTIYPFTFSAIVGAPVALGLPVRTAMWAVTSVSLTGTLWAYHWMGRAFLKPVPAAWAAVALPLVFYAPQNGYWLLPNPFNASLVCVFLGLGLVARGTRAHEGATPRLVAGGAVLGLSGLFWYGHLLWIVPFAVAWGWGRWRSFQRLVLGASLPALVLVLHIGILWKDDNLGSSGITNQGSFELVERVSAMARNLVTLSGDARLGAAPWWIGALVLPALVVFLVRRSEQEVDRPRILRVLAPILFACIVYAGLQLTFWRPFSWRFTFLLYSVLLVAVAGTRPWHVAGRAVGPIAVLGLAGMVCAPQWMRLVVWFSVEVDKTYEEAVRGVAETLDEHTAHDEPVFASTVTWEETMASCAPRPTLVDRNGGTYKYAPARIAGPRWEVLQRVRGLGEAEEILALLEPYGFRVAVVSKKDRADPGFEVLATSFAQLFANEQYVVVDLSRRE